MDQLALHDFHQALGGRFDTIGKQPIVSHYGDPDEEYRALTQKATFLDLSCRGRVCLTGADRQSFLNGQVTNAVPAPEERSGVYAFLTNNKGRIQSDLLVYSLPEEILLDFEPGLNDGVIERLEGYVVADDVQVVEVGSLYGLLSIQGPLSGEVVAKLGVDMEWPTDRFQYSRIQDPRLGEIYVVNHPRVGSSGYDCFAPNESLRELAERITQGLKDLGGRPVGFQAFETARIEAGIPRYGVDIDETNLAPEPSVAEEGISYTKGCYIGQEVVARVRTYGQVTKRLRGLLLPDDLTQLPSKGVKLWNGAKAVGYITSAVDSPQFGRKLALGYVRKECWQPGSELVGQMGEEQFTVTVVELPFTSSKLS